MLFITVLTEMLTHSEITSFKLTIFGSTRQKTKGLFGTLTSIKM